MSSSTDELFPRCPDCGSCMTDTDRGSECMANVYNMGGCSTYAELKRLRPLVAEVEALRVCMLNLVTYTEACEGLLNVTPSGQVAAARVLLSRGGA